MNAREALRRLLALTDISQAELARKLGENENWVNHRVTGYTTIKADDLSRLAAALGVEPEDFFRDVPDVEEAREQLRRLIEESEQLIRRAAGLPPLLQLVSERPEEQEPSGQRDQAPEFEPMSAEVVEQAARRALELTINSTRQEIREGVESGRLGRTLAEGLMPAFEAFSASQQATMLEVIRQQVGTNPAQIAETVAGMLRPALAAVPEAVRSVIREELGRAPRQTRPEGEARPGRQRVETPGLLPDELLARIYAREKISPSKVRRIEEILAEPEE